MFKASPGSFRHIFAGRGHFGGWLVHRWSEYGLIAIEEWSTAFLWTVARKGGVEFYMGHNTNRHWHFS